mmetsp:Transcript_101173/g.241185  ORF Transcript_101173/g.241185 Transcript_101173/m.241185 type:complete len:214 (+) Transcript_101173:305-946(+)
MNRFPIIRLPKPMGPMGLSELQLSRRSRALHWGAVAQPVIQVAKELVEAAVSPVMMQLMAICAPQQLWRHAVAGPGQIEARVRLGEQVGHQHVVHQPTELMLGAAQEWQVLDQDVHQHLHGPIHQRVVHHQLRAQEIGAADRVNLELMVHFMMIPRVGELVHQQVDPKKNEVVRPNPERYLAGQADSRRRVSGQAGALLQGQEDKDGAQIQRK